MILDENMDITLKCSDLLRPYLPNSNLTTVFYNAICDKLNAYPVSLIKDWIRSPHTIDESSLRKIFMLKSDQRMLGVGTHYGVPESPGRYIIIHFAGIEVAFEDLVWKEMMKGIAPETYDNFLKSNNYPDGYSYFNLDINNIS